MLTSKERRRFCQLLALYVIGAISDEEREEFIQFIREKEFDLYSTTTLGKGQVLEEHQGKISEMYSEEEWGKVPEGEWEVPEMLGEAFAGLRLLPYFDSEIRNKVVKRLNLKGNLALIAIPRTRP